MNKSQIVKDDFNSIQEMEEFKGAVERIAAKQLPGRESLIDCMKADFEYETWDDSHLSDKGI